MDKVSILNRIRELRIKRGISEREMSRALGHYPSYLANLAAGKKMPSLEVVEDCCNYFGMTISEFFNDDYHGDASDQYIIKKINEIATIEDKQKIVKLLNALDKKRIKILFDILDDYIKG